MGANPNPNPNPSPHQVLELCAAPGGKSTHLAEIMRDQGRVLSVEVSARKLPYISPRSPLYLP